MEEQLPLDITTYDNADVTRTGDGRTQLNLKPEGQYIFNFANGVDPHLIMFTPLQKDRGEFIKYRFTVKTQTSTDANPEDFKSGEVRSSNDLHNWLSIIVNVSILLKVVFENLWS